MVPNTEFSDPSSMANLSPRRTAVGASNFKSQATASLNAEAEPWFVHLNDNRVVATNQRETEPELSVEDGSALDRLATREDLDTFEQHESKLGPGTAEDHQQAEAVAVQAVAAALIRIASGANMKGMVRMGSSSGTKMG